MAQVKVVPGNITTVPAESLITALDLQALGQGEVDAAIREVAGDMFHDQMHAAAPFVDGTASFIQGGKHPGKFKNVIFIVDDHKLPLREIVKAGLTAADAAGQCTVSLPIIRMSGLDEGETKEAIDEMALAVSEFVSESPVSLKAINLVVHNDIAVERSLRAALSKSFSPSAR